MQRVKVWGNAQHGLCTNGVVALPGGLTKTLANTTPNGDTRLVKFPWTPAIDLADHELAALLAEGKVLEDYGLVYSDGWLYDQAHPAHAWLYQDSLHQVWSVHIRSTTGLSITGGTVTLDLDYTRFGLFKKVDPIEPPVAVTGTVSVALNTSITQTVAAAASLQDVSPDGRKALVKVTESSLTDSPVQTSFVEITLSGDIDAESGLGLMTSAAELKTVAECWAVTGTETIHQTHRDTFERIEVETINPHPPTGPPNGSVVFDWREYEITYALVPNGVLLQDQPRTYSYTFNTIESAAYDKDGTPHFFGVKADYEETYTLDYQVSVSGQVDVLHTGRAYYNGDGSYSHTFVENHSATGTCEATTSQEDVITKRMEYGLTRDGVVIHNLTADFARDDDFSETFSKDSDDMYVLLNSHVIPEVNTVNVNTKTGTSSAFNGAAFVYPDEANFNPYLVRFRALFNQTPGFDRSSQFLVTSSDTDKNDDAKLHKLTNRMFCLMSGKQLDMSTGPDVDFGPIAHSEGVEAGSVTTDRQNTNSTLHPLTGDVVRNQPAGTFVNYT